jgi:hypothetical protein
MIDDSMFAAVNREPAMWDSTNSPGTELMSATLNGGAPS